MKTKISKHSLRKIELARELNVSPALVTAWLRRGLIRARADGRLEPEEVFLALYRYWMPRFDWWQKPVGEMGQRLRATWQAAERAAALNLSDL